MDLLIFGAVRPTFQLENAFGFVVLFFRTFRAGNGFLDCQGRSLHNFGLRMDSLINYQRGPSDLPG